MRGRGRLRLAVFSLLPGLLLFAAGEAALRVAGFRYASTPLEVHAFLERPEGLVERELRFRNRGGVERFVKDPRQLWVPKRSPLAAHSLAPPPGSFRIAALGDSCTAHCAGTPDSFPDLLAGLLLGAGPGRVEVLNAGVAAHSSFQGLQRLRHEVLPYRPDLLTIFYGWNDHWIAAVPDREVRLRSGIETSLVNLLERSRVYQALHAGLARLRRAVAPGPRPSAGGAVPLRVPIDQYRENLAEMVALARARGMRVLLITAPQAIPPGWNEPGLLPLPAPRVVALHQRYNEVVRGLAREADVPLLDLALEVSQRPPGSVMASDGIHFHARGCRFVARAVARRLSELGLP